MIQIKRKNVNELAQAHYQALKPYLEKKLKYKKGELFAFLRNNLERVIAGSPEELVKIIKDIPLITKKKNAINKIFNYDYFKKYGAYRLAKYLNVNVCPYCNRQYTFTVIKRKNQHGKTRPEFDHFFTQEDFPYLKLSFFNLIPCCNTCNVYFKKREIFTLKRNIHPYVEGFENAVKFRIQLRKKSKFKPEEIENWYGINFFNGAYESFDIKLKVRKPSTSLERKANENIKIFHLEPLYNQHKDYVIELVQKAEIYNSDYINSLFNEYEGKLFNNKNDIYRMLLSNYVSPDDFEKRVLSKLTRDLSDELGIFN